MESFISFFISQIDIASLYRFSRSGEWISFPNGVLKVTEEQYWKIDREYIIAVRKEEYGYRCLTNEKQFYLENYPDMVIEKSGIDELILMEKKEK